MDVYQRMKELNITLPPAPAKGGIYSPVRQFGANLAYLSGCGPVTDGTPIRGRLGAEFTAEQGVSYSKNCILNLLAALEREIGDLNRVKSVAKITVFVASANDFYEQPFVANGGSQLLLDLFGEEKGLPARSAIGVNVLPGNIPVEIEALFELE